MQFTRESKFYVIQFQTKIKRTTDNTKIREATQQSDSLWISFIFSQMFAKWVFWFKLAYNDGIIIDCNKNRASDIDI